MRSIEKLTCPQDGKVNGLFVDKGLIVNSVDKGLQIATESVTTLGGVKVLIHADAGLKSSESEKVDQHPL